MESLLELEPIFVYRAWTWIRFEKDGAEYCYVLPDLRVVTFIIKQYFSTKTVRRGYLPTDAETQQAVAWELPTNNTVCGDSWVRWDDQVEHRWGSSWMTGRFGEDNALPFRLPALNTWPSWYRQLIFTEWRIRKHVASFDMRQRRHWLFCSLLI